MTPFCLPLGLDAILLAHKSRLEAVIHDASAVGGQFSLFLASLWPLLVSSLLTISATGES